LVRIDIRPAAVTDAEAIQRIYAPIVENTAISFEYVPPSVVKIAERITSTSRTHPYLVAIDGSGVCGYVYANAHRERAAYRHSVDTNPASIALHESVGFAPLGIYREVGFKFDRWHDVGWWQCPLMR
jgi:L-amino acid N-acyltransferase YncA